MQPVRMMLACVLLFQAAAPVQPVEAQATLSLPALLAEAQRVNPSIRASRLRWESAQAKVPLATALPAPKIGVEFEEIPKGSVKFNQATLMYQLIQSIPFPGKLSLRKQVALKEAQVAAMAFKQTEWEVLTDLKRAYYDVVLLDREAEVQREQVVWLRQAVQTANAGYTTGASAHADLLEAQSALLEATNQVSVLEQRRQAMVAHLNHLVNRSLHTEIGSLEMPALAPVPLTLEELLLMAQAHQPELLAFRYTAERAAASVKLSKRELLPDVETMAELRDPAMGPIGPWDLSLAVALPFWFWTKWQYGVKVAIRDRDSAQAASEAMEQEIARRIHEHWHEAHAAYTTAALSRDGLLPLSQQVVTSALAAYQSGRGSLRELLAALQRQAEQRRIAAQRLVDLEQHVVMLEQAAGISLRATHKQ
jgi:outer membrane protein TolC